MTPPAKTLKGAKINCFQGSIALCHTGSIARGFSNGWQYTVLHIARNGYWNTVNLKTSGEFSIYGGEKFYIALENPWGYGRQKVYVNATFYFTEKNSEY